MLQNENVDTQQAWIRSQRRWSYSQKDKVHAAISSSSGITPTMRRICMCEHKEGDGNSIVVPPNGISYVKFHKCNNKWGCPICASYYLGKQKAKIKNLLELAKSTGYALCVLTFTHPHHLEQTPNELIDRHKLARRILGKNGSLKRIKNKSDSRGVYLPIT